MLYFDQVHPIILENSSKEDREYAKKLSKSEIYKLNGELLNNLYQSVLRCNVDFGDIPLSKGDLSKLKNFNTLECLDLLHDLMQKNGIDEPAVQDIKKCVNNILKLKPSFTEAFEVDNKYIMTLYNTMVLCVIDATSTIIASYMDYLIGPNRVGYSITNKYDRGRGTLAIDNIRKFNSLVDDCSMEKTLKQLLEYQRKNFMGEEFVGIGFVVVGLLSIVPIMRELIYFFYHSRVTISDYLNMEASFIENHKLTIEMSTIHNEKKKKDIIRKQDAQIKKMRRLADKIAINSVDKSDYTRMKTKEDEGIWSLSALEKNISKKSFQELNDEELKFM